MSHNTNTSPTVVSSDKLCQVHHLFTCPSGAETACGSSEDSLYILLSDAVVGEGGCTDRCEWSRQTGLSPPPQATTRYVLHVSY